LFGLSNVVNAQTFFKDLYTVSYYSSNPDQFINVNGTMYIHTKAGGYDNQIWKSDGTAAGTVLLMDNIISSQQTTPVQMFNMNNNLYFFVNPNLGPYSLNEATLWKSDGTSVGTILVDSLITRAPFTYPSDASARNFTVVGNKLFFQMGKGNGLELWVTDGSVGGAHEVIDLLPGSVGGLSDQPMVAYNGKLYFSAAAATDDYELYTNDGTAAGTMLVKDIDVNNTVARSSAPTNFIEYNSELYFYAKSGVTGSSNGTTDMWKTNGTAAGTMLVAAGQFGAGQVVFKNELYFIRNTGLWKTDGTAGGTVFVTDSVSAIAGANSNYLIASFGTSLSVAPYIKMHYRRTDGTTAVSVSTNVGYGASFAVLNDKMYFSGIGNGLWMSDGTDAGSGQLATNNSGGFFVFNNNLYYSGYTTNAQNSSAGYGNELWWINSAATGIAQSNNDQTLLVYPNPSTGIFTVTSSIQLSELRIYNVLGKLIETKKINSKEISIDLSGKEKGIYFYELLDKNQNAKTGKILLD
jgi:ELWxxDGT repeat protein